MIHTFVSGLLVTSMLCTASAQAQTAPAHTLTVTTGHRFIEVALKAEDAKLADVAADLAKRLGARVHLGPSLRQETVTATIQQSGLEAALTLLAPRVFVDYEVRQEAGATPREIYLLGPTDPAPAINTGARGKSEGLLITGHTEDVPGARDEEPLKISGDRQGLTITANKQPLSLVAMMVADLLGIPLELKFEAADLVQIDIPYFALPEDVITRLSPHLRLFVRVDVTSQQRSPLKLVAERVEAR